MALKNDIQDRLEQLVKDAREMEGVAVADAARIENAVITASNAVRGVNVAGDKPPAMEAYDPAFEQVQSQTQAVEAGGQPNVHPLSGEPVPPGSTEGVRPEGVAAGPGVVPEQDPARRTGDTDTPEPALNPGDPVLAKDHLETKQQDPALAGADNDGSIVPDVKPGGLLPEGSDAPKG
jgi:hypothetical protein